MKKTNLIPKSDTWVKTKVANLLKYAPSGIYFMRAKIRGKLVRKSLKTRNYEAARIKLRDFHAAETERLSKWSGDDASFGALSQEWSERDLASHEIKHSTKLTHKYKLIAIHKSWPELANTEVHNLTYNALDKWARRYRDMYSASRYNGSIDLMRGILDLAVEKGLIAHNPAAKLKKASVPQKEIALPSQSQFAQMLARLDDHGWKSSTAVIRFLAFTGMRISEAFAVTPAMIDLNRGEIRLPGAVTKNGKPRSIPIIDDLRPWLIKWLSDYTQSRREGGLMPFKDVNQSLETVCKFLGIPRITNHDLRHLFVSRCIESGVDVRTVAAWAGHQDGGALILKTYAHLRNEHSQNMAKLVKFTDSPAGNIIQIDASA